MGDVVERITAHLASGGLFNPELADHIAVRDLLIDARAQLAEQSEQAEALRGALSDSQSTLSAIKAECAARCDQEEDQMAAHIVEICQTTMTTNAAALAQPKGGGQ